MDKKYPLVRVTWRDANSFAGWFSAGDTDIDLAEITTIGYLISEDTHKLVIASSIDKDDGINTVMAIPHSWQTVYERID